MKFKQLNIENILAMMPLAQLLNPNLGEETLHQRQRDMFKHTHYHCFGLYHNAELIALSSAWSTTRLYSGKQLELDNVVVLPKLRSKGIGNLFMQMIENWALERGYQTIELNSYVENTASHKFYNRRSYKILGHHFQKRLTTE